MINKNEFINKLLIILMFMSVFFTISIRQDEGVPPISVQSIIKLNIDTNEAIRKIESEKPYIDIISSQSYKAMVATTNFKHKVIEYDSNNQPSKIKDQSTGQIYDIIDDTYDESEKTISDRNVIIESNKKIERLKYNRVIQIMLGAAFIFIYFAFIKISLDGLSQERGFYIGK